jgi:hypothetical protein
MPRDPDRNDIMAQVRITDFAGFVPNADPHDLPAGVSVVQINAIAQRPGELRVRHGAKVVSFEN